MESNYKVYKHTFPNGKVYIGITKLKPKYRWGHNGNGYYRHPFLINAIKKFGWDNIKHEVLFENLTRQEAELKEVELISLHKSNQRQFGYNIQNGGYSKGKYNEETILKMSIIKRGRKHTLESRQKLSKSLKGIKKDDEWKRKISLGNKGKKRSLEVREMNSRVHSKAVQCIETGIIYKNAKEAAHMLGYNNRGTNIQNAVNREDKTAYKFHWRYIC